MTRSDRSPASGASPFLSDEEQAAIFSDLVTQVSAHYATDEAVRTAVFDTLHDERQRLETHGIGDVEEALEFYEALYREAVIAGPDHYRALLRRLITRFAQEIAGHFDMRTYRWATEVVSPALTLIFNAMSPLRVLSTLSEGLHGLESRVNILGEHETLVALAKRGTLMVLPTHSSHFDSVAVSYALHALGLPPLLYGAGYNLFEKPLLGYFLSNLGAYKVDRDKKAELYKRTLKAYTRLTLERGYHSLFFPGGARSRTGRIEDRLKLGLVGEGIHAYVNNLQHKRPNPDIFVVPCTVNYQLILEAENLIAAERGENPQFPGGLGVDASDKPHQVLNFIRRIFALDAPIDVVFGAPLDLFGNRVDALGISRDTRGRVVDRAAQVRRGGRAGHDEARDRRYTRQLAEAVLETYARESVVNSVHVVAAAVMDWLTQHNPGVSAHALASLSGTPQAIPLSQIYREVSALTGQLEALREQGLVRLDRALVSDDAVGIVTLAIRHLGSFHRRAVLTRRGDMLLPHDIPLLLFYANRLAHQPLTFHDMGLSELASGPERFKRVVRDSAYPLRIYNDRPLPTGYGGDVFVWDIDKTYLNTRFATLSGLARIPFEFAVDKRPICGMPEVLRGIRRGSGSEWLNPPLYFVSASPWQLRPVIARRMLLDGVQPDGFIFKDCGRTLAQGRPGRLKEQLGFKLCALLAGRISRPDVQEVLFGDDTESDAEAYWLYGHLINRTMTGSAVRRYLARSEVSDDDRNILMQYMRALGDHGGGVRRAYIHLANGTSPSVFREFAPFVVPVRDSLQMALALAADGHVAPDVVTRVATTLRNAGRFRKEHLADALDRGICTPAELALV